MYNNLPELGPSRRRPPYRRAPRPVPNTMGSWFSEWIHQPLKEWKFPAATAAIIFGGAAAGSATGMYTTTLGTSIWSGLKTAGSYFYSPGGTTGGGTVLVDGAMVTAPVATTAPTGILPTVLGVGVPGYGWVGSLGTGAVQLGTGIAKSLTGTPSGAKTTTPTSTTPGAGTTIGPEPPPSTGIGTTIADVIKNLVSGGSQVPTPEETSAEQWLAAETVLPGVTNKNLTLLGIGGGILLLFVLSGRRK